MASKSTQRVVAILAAAAVAVPLIATSEGTVKVGYLDPVRIVTSCTGHTGPDAILGRVYSDDECAAQLAQDAVKHGLQIDRCLPDAVPVRTHAAFISFAFNVGPGAFCKSTLSRKAMAGDLVGACNELPKWDKAGGKVLPGLVTRRARERDLCLSGLIRPAVVAQWSSPCMTYSPYPHACTHGAIRV